MAQVVGKIYPNGEFGVARVKKFNPDPVVKTKLTRKQELVIEYLPQIGIDGILAVDGKAEGSPPLGLVGLSNFTARAERGSNGISRQSARMVRNAAYLVQERWGAKHLSFVTLTLPSVTPQESVQLSQVWHRIVDNLREAILDRLEKAGLPRVLVGVTEIQSSRLEKTSVLGLHLHLLFVGRHAYGSWQITTEEIDALWQKIVTNQCPGNWDFSKACQMKMVKNSAAGYLGKYMSKGAVATALVREQCIGACVPKAWHTMTRTLLRWVKSRIVSESDIIHSLWEDCWAETPSLCSFRKLIVVDINEGERYVCGAFGRVKSEFLDWLKSDRHEGFCRIY